MNRKEEKSCWVKHKANILPSFLHLTRLSNKLLKGKLKMKTNPKTSNSSSRHVLKQKETRDFSHKTFFTGKKEDENPIINFGKKANRRTKNIWRNPIFHLRLFSFFPPSFFFVVTNRQWEISDLVFHQHQAEKIYFQARLNI